MGRSAAPLVSSRLALLTLCSAVGRSPEAFAP